MRAGYGLAVGVLATALAGSGCCKLCDWCCGPESQEKRLKLNEGPPPLESPAHMSEGARGVNVIPDQPAGGVPAARTGPVGAYGGPGN